MLPPERETATKQDAKQEHARPQWKNIIRLTLLATFLAVCAVGLKNYVQDKRQQRKETEEQILLQDFVMRLNALQKHQFILRTKITGMPVSDEQLIIYRKNLDETMIPMCERLIQDYHSLPLEAKKLILKPDGRKLEEEQLEQALKQTLQQLRNTSQALEAETLKRTMEKNPQPIQAI